MKQYIYFMISFLLACGTLIGSEEPTEVSLTPINLALNLKSGLHQIKASQPCDQKFLSNCANLLLHKQNMQALCDTVEALALLTTSCKKYSDIQGKSIYLGVPQSSSKIKTVIKTPHGPIAQTTKDQYSYVVDTPEELALAIKLLNHKTFCLTHKVTKKEQCNRLYPFLSYLTSTNVNLRKIAATAIYNDCSVYLEEIYQQQAKFVLNYCSQYSDRNNFVNQYVDAFTRVSVPFDIFITLEAFDLTSIAKEKIVALNELWTTLSTRMLLALPEHEQSPLCDEEDQIVYAEALYQALLHIMKEEKSEDFEYLPSVLYRAKLAHKMAHALNTSGQTVEPPVQASKKSNAASAPSSISSSCSQEEAQTEVAPEAVTTANTPPDTITQQNTELRYAQRVINQYNKSLTTRDVYHGFSWEIDPYIIAHGQLTMKANPKTGALEKHYSIPGQIEWKENGKTFQRFIVIALCMGSNDVIYHRGLVYSSWNQLVQDHYDQYGKDIEWPTLAMSTAIKNTTTKSFSQKPTIPTTTSDLTVSFSDPQLRCTISLFKVN